MRKVLLINPTITKARHARFPLAIMSLANAIEHRFAPTIIDGNVDHDYIAKACSAVREQRIDAVGVTVMGGPQIPTAAAVSKAIRAVSPQTPIIWGGYFPTICPVPSIGAPFVDYVIRGQGEVALLDLLQAMFPIDEAALEAIAGLTWQRRGLVVHNKDRLFTTAPSERSLPYARLENPGQYLGRTYLGRRTAGYQAALGCRFRCTFCGVATMFKGKTALPTAARLKHDLAILKNDLGADAIQFYDHNFFDREVDMVPLLEVLAALELPWWCFARSDALLNLSEASWKLVRKSGLRMAYIGAESPDDKLLREVRKGTRADQTLAVVEKCRSNGVIPELSFMLAPPDDPEGATERTFEFIREIKRVYPRTEIMIYIYTPLPTSPHSAQSRSHATRALLDVEGHPIVFPDSVEEWSSPKWVNYWCHMDAPWMSERLRRRILDFTTVLGCRFPTITDIRSPPLGKAALRVLASWRYRFQKYGHPWELDLSQRIIRLHNPRASSL